MRLYPNREWRCETNCNEFEAYSRKKKCLRIDGENIDDALSNSIINFELLISAKL